MYVQVFWRTHEKSTVQVHANNIKCNTCNLIVGKLVTGQGLNNFLSPAMRGVQTQVVPWICHCVVNLRKNFHQKYNFKKLLNNLKFKPVYA